MAIRALNKASKKETLKNTKKLDEFIGRGGTVPDVKKNTDTDHRLTLRIPSSLMDAVDKMRCNRLGKISRNLMILEIIESHAKRKGTL